MSKLVCFDWAIKRLLRNKANHKVIEGLLESLLGEKFIIQEFLESESNQKSQQDKYNRVDMLAKDTHGRLFIFEIQNNRETDYFQRILYGASSVVTQYLNIGDRYAKVKKVYSINIVYFDLGQGKDYVYHGKTEFRGMHQQNDVLKLSPKQNEMFYGGKDADKEAGDLFPEYYILKVNNFDDVAKTPLDEWISFLKHTDLSAGSSAPGLKYVDQVMRYEALSGPERDAYDEYIINAIRTRSEMESSYIMGKDEGFEEGMEKGIEEGIEKGIAKGAREKAFEMARSLKALGVAPCIIAQSAGLTPEELARL